MTALAGEEEEQGAGCKWPGLVLSLEAREAICLLYQLSSPTHLSIAIRHDLFMLPLLTASRYSESNFTGSKLSHQLSKQKTLPDCCPTSMPAYKSFLNKTAQNKQNTTLMYIQLSRETICVWLLSYQVGTLLCFN